MAAVSGDGTSSIRDHVTSQTARAAGSPLVIGAVVAWLAITWLVGLRQGFLFLVGIGFGAVLAGVSFGFTTGWRVWIRERDPTGFLAQLLAIGLAMLVSIPLIAEVHGMATVASQAIRDSGIGGYPRTANDGSSHARPGARASAHAVGRHRGGRRASHRRLPLRRSGRPWPSRRARCSPPPPTLTTSRSRPPRAASSRPAATATRSCSCAAASRSPRSCASTCGSCSATSPARAGTSREAPAPAWSRGGRERLSGSPPCPARAARRGPRRPRREPRTLRPRRPPSRERLQDAAEALISAAQRHLRGLISDRKKPAICGIAARKPPTASGRRC